jgi:protein tyrosine phosphatase (PTP) superfamily phosphohydrolase (DUF442 family)
LLPTRIAIRALALIITLAGAIGCAPHPTAPPAATAPPSPAIPQVIVPPDSTPQHPLASPIPGVENFGFISADLWRGARPTTQGVATLAAMGVRTIINLELLENPAATPPPPGVRIVHLPCSGWQCDRVDTAAVLAAIRDNSKPVFIHCREGRDRTGLAVAAYRLSQGMPAQSAIEELNNFHVNPWWQPFIQRRIQQLAQQDPQ